jgi:hypothetical protein
MNKIQEAILNNINTITMSSRTRNYEDMKMIDADCVDIIDLPPDWFRRANDIFAATYAHCLARYSDSGMDCVDFYGNNLELKFVIIDSNDYVIGTSGKSIKRKNSDSNIHNAVQAIFRVYPGTANDHHSTDTALVIYSKNHDCFIGGFIMNGNAIQSLVHSDNKTSVTRPVSLVQFIQHGYEFDSLVPHIGWNEYENALYNFLRAKQGLMTEEEADDAINTWVSLADQNNLKTL